MPTMIAGREINFGLWYDFRNPEQWRRPASQVYAETLDHIAYAERLGFDTIWTSEHHFIEDDYSPSLLPICAAIAARTSRVRIGTNVLLLPLHDPVRVAEDAATVDAISGGRLDLGVAVGYKREEFTGFGIDRRERAARMEEACSVIRRAWAPGPFSFDGKHYRYTDIDVTPKPTQDPMPLWIGGFSEAAVRRAARLGDGLVAAANVISVFLDEWRKQGRDGEPKIAMTLPWSFVADDPDEAWAEIAPQVLHQNQNYARWFTAADMALFPAIPETADEIRARNPNVMVTPEQARAIVERMARELPVTHLYWWAIPPGLPPRAAYGSMERFSRVVMA